MFGEKLKYAIILFFQKHFFFKPIKSDEHHRLKRIVFQFSYKFI